MYKKIVILKIAILSILISCTNNNNESSYLKQMHADKMATQGIYYYWHGGDLKKAEKEFFKGITLKGNLDAVAYFFSKASELDPTRLAYKFSLASTKIIQGKVEEAINAYNQILDLNPKNFEAILLKNIYENFNSKNLDFQEMFNILDKIDKERSSLYKKKIERTIKIMKTNINTEASKVIKNFNYDEDHVILTLGYALKDDGSMRELLVKRLEKTLEMHKLYPNSKIILTGGVQKNGVTESFQMKNWLVSKGVDPNLIYLEDRARDTVGNALFSVLILKKLNPKVITLITSATHIRRGIVVFSEAIENEDLNIKINNLVIQDFNSDQEMKNISRNEKLVIFRDLIRTSGISAYPGMQS